MVQKVLVVAALAAIVSGCSPARLFIHPREELIGTPAEFCPAFEDVTMPRADGGVTRAWWLPNPASDAAVVLFGGNSGNRSHHLAYARIAFDAGLSVLMPDYQGFGPGGGEPSLAAFGPDGEAAVAWAAGKSKRVGVWGISLGSAVAFHAAAARPDVVKAVCVEGAFRLAPAIRHYVGLSLPRFLAVPVADLTRALFIPDDSDPELTLPLVPRDVPIFFLHGDRDGLTRTVWAGELFEEAFEHPRSFWLMDETGHAPEPLRSEEGEYQEQIAGFLREALLGEPRATTATTWRTQPAGDGWNVEATVVAGGPFPAAVEVDAIADGATARARLWIQASPAIVTLHVAAEPVAVSARRWRRVEPDGDSWKPARSAIAAQYRWLRDVDEAAEGGKAPVEQLLKAEVDPVLAPMLSRALFLAAFAATDRATAEALLVRLVETAAVRPRHYILGDATYYACEPWSRENLVPVARDVYALKGWDPAALDEKLRALPRPVGDK